jgi:Secretion system C-terminal sorting domain
MQTALHTNEYNTRHIQPQHLLQSVRFSYKFAFQVVMLFCATWFVQNAQAAKYYVNDAYTADDVYTTAAGNDGNNGTTPSTPKATVQAIINAYTLVASDTLLIDHGTYTESFSITNADKGSIVTGTPFRANYVVIKGAGYTKTLFTAAAAAKFNLFINRAEYIWVEGISFSNSNATDSSFNIVKEYGNSSVIKLCKLNNTSTTVPSGKPAINIFLRSTKNTSIGAQRTLITNNVLDNSSQDGIGVFVYGDVDSSRIQYNTITMTGTNGRGILFDCLFNAPDEVSATASYWPVVDTVFKNTITANNHGIECNSSSTSNKLYTYLIEGNTITINNTTAPRSSIYLYNCGKPSAEDFKIMKNRLRGGYAGIYIFDRGEYLKIYNNYICSIFGLFSNNYIGGGTDRENEFLHNSLYTTGSCLYFNNESQDDWDVRNNILYTTANAPSACINVVTWSNSGYNFESLNGNLFYRTGTAFIGRFNSSTFSTLALWQGQDISFNSTNDPNSLDRIPPYQNTSNCDLDLVQDLVNWGGVGFGGYPNRNGSFGVNLVGTVTSDFKNIPARAFPTIGAFEVGSAILPVFWFAFDAKLSGAVVNLNWQTSFENNNRYFEVEKSADGRTWGTVRRINGAGESKTVRSYQTNDHQPLPGTSFYRIKQIGNDGSVTYSDVRMVHNNKTGFAVFPNPSSGVVVVAGNKYQSTNIRVLDVTGKLIQNLNGFGNRFRIDLSGKAPGTYILLVNGTEHLQVVKTQ